MKEAGELMMVSRSGRMGNAETTQRQLMLESCSHGKTASHDDNHRKAKLR